MGFGFDRSVLGMLAQNSRLVVIGNNIANSQTCGYKASDVNFADLFASTAGLASSGEELGTGVCIDGTISDWSPGEIVTTTNPANLGIEGDGFYAVKNPTNGNTYYTRVGDFSLAKLPNTINNGSGYAFMRTDGSILCGSYNTSVNTIPTPSALDIGADGNLNYAQGPLYLYAQKYDDGTLGHGTKGWYEWDDAGWTTPNGSVPSPTKFNITSDGIVTAEPSGASTGMEKAGDFRIEFRIDRTENSKPVGASGSVLVDAMTSARIGLQRFGTPDALLRYEGGNFIATPASGPINTFSTGGTPRASVPHANGNGGIHQGMLESSNVDMAKELTNMIVTQRAYQGCSKSLSTKDQMLQTLLQLR